MILIIDLIFHMLISSFFTYLIDEYRLSLRKKLGRCTVFFGIATEGLFQGDRAPSYRVRPARRRGRPVADDVKKNESTCFGLKPGNTKRPATWHVCWKVETPARRAERVGKPG